MNGGAGNDTLVWNNGDGSDIVDGDAGNDGVEVNGAPTLGDVFTLEPDAGRIKFQRTNLVPFTLDTATERFEVNGLGGNDSSRRATAWARSRCCPSTAAPVWTRSMAPTGRT